MNSSDPTSAGYTLIELLVVLAILSLVAAFAAPAAISAVEGATSRSDARRLVSELLDLQHLAIEKQVTIAIRTGPTPRVEGGAQLNLSDGETLAFAHGEDGLVYYPDGTSSGATIRIGEPRGGLLVTVAWLTGEVTIGSGP